MSRALILSVIFAAAAAGARDLDSFTPGEERTPEQLRAEKERVRGVIERYDAPVLAPAQPFPWMGLGIGLLTLLAASPFAIRFYRETTSEMANVNTFGSRRRQREDN